MPVEEYDELSKLVDKLLTEKAHLQLSVEKQADQLKVNTSFLSSHFLCLSFAIITICTRGLIDRQFVFLLL